MRLVLDIFHKPEVVITRPDAKSSWHSPLKTNRDKILETLKKANSDGDQALVLNTLTEINDLDLIRDLFEPNVIANQDQKTINLFYELANNYDPTIKNEALRIIFEFAQYSSHSLVPKAYTESTDDRSVEILENIKQYLSSADQETSMHYASELATILGHHELHDRQAFSIGTANATSVNNNLLHTLKCSKGIGTIIFKLLNETTFTEDNRKLMQTALSAQADKSTLDANARANMRIYLQNTLVGRAGSWSSCYFNLTYTDLKNNPTKEITYNLSNLLDDICDDGIEKASAKLINHYVKAIEYKELLRASDPDSPEVKKIEKALQQSYKLIFDDNKLAAINDEGSIIRDSLRETFEQKGLVQFLTGLYSKTDLPSNQAEIQIVANAYSDAFTGERLELKQAGKAEPVVSVPEYNQFITNKETAYTKTIDSLASSILSENGITDPIQTTQQLKDLESEWKTYFTEKEGLEDEESAIDSIVERISQDFEYKVERPTEEGTRLSIISLRELVLNELLPQNFLDYGPEQEQHIKRSGAVNELRVIMAKREHELNSEELLIRNLVNEDRINFERITNSEDNKGTIESLFHERMNGFPSPTSSLVAGFELIRRIDSSKESDIIKLKAKTKVINEILGFQHKPDVFGNLASLENPINLSHSKDLTKLRQQITVLHNLKESITKKSEQRFAREISSFVKGTISADRQESALGAAQEKLGQIRTKLEAHKGADGTEQLKIEDEIQSILGFKPNNDGTLNEDFQFMLDGLTNSSHDFKPFDIFMEALKAVFNYISTFTNELKSSK